MMMLIAGLLAAAAAPLHADDLEAAFEVRVEAGRAGCIIAFNGRRLDRQAYAEELIAHARLRGATRAVVKLGRPAPHPCVDDVIDTLRSAGVADVTLVADEPK